MKRKVRKSKKSDRLLPGRCGCGHKFMFDPRAPKCPNCWKASHGTVLHRSICVC